MLSIAFSYTRFSNCMEELTGFGTTKSTTLPCLVNKYLNSLRDENDEANYT